MIEIIHRDNGTFYCIETESVTKSEKKIAVKRTATPLVINKTNDTEERQVDVQISPTSAQEGVV